MHVYTCILSYETDLLNSCLTQKDLVKDATFNRCLKMVDVPVCTPTLMYAINVPDKNIKQSDNCWVLLTDILLFFNLSKYK